MSVARKVTVDYELPIMEQVAREHGFSIRHNSTVAGWAGSDMTNGQKAELVLKNPAHSYEIGFQRKENKTELIADFHGGHVQEDINNLLPSYYEAALSRSQRFKIKNVEKVENKLRIVIGR